MRILVTGSRNWTDAEAIHTALDEIARQALRVGEEVTVVHGCARGADILADAWCRQRRHDWPVTVERHPADWAKLGRKAGWLRNRHMVRLGADVCLAFIRDGSAGATGCADLAEAAGIRTARFVVRTVEPMPDSADDLDAPQVAPQCGRCGSDDNCPCDPAAARAFTALCGVPAGPRWLREQLAQQQA